MIVAVAILAFADVLEPMIVELAQERAVAFVPKIGGTYKLFKHSGHVNAKGSPVRLPRNILAVFLDLRQDVVHFVTEGHLLNAGGRFPIEIVRDTREVSV